MNRNHQVAILMVGRPFQKSERAFQLEGSLNLAIISNVSHIHNRELLHG